MSTISDVEQEPKVDRELLGRAMRGALVGAVVLFCLGFALVTKEVSEAPVIARIGIAAFLAFWTGPFFGMVGGLGYHQLQEHRAGHDHHGATAGKLAHAS